MIIVHLPTPISTNALFANVRGRGRVKTARYCAWQKKATAMIWEQQPLPRFDGPVEIMFLIGEVGTRSSMDGDNCLKCLLDALVYGGVLADDNRKIVRAVGMQWVKGKSGTTASIFPLEDKPND